VKAVDWLSKPYDPGARKLTWFPFLFAVYDFFSVVLAGVILAGVASGHSLLEYLSSDFLTTFALLIVPTSALMLGVSLLPPSRFGPVARPRWNFLVCCISFSAIAGWFLGGESYFATLIAALGGLTGMVTFLRCAEQPRWIRK
jgi:hypothetical protein